MSVAELADLAGVDPKTVRRHCARGYIEGADKPGRDWVIPVAGAEKYLRSYTPYQGNTRSGRAGTSQPDPA